MIVVIVLAAFAVMTAAAFAGTGRLGSWRAPVTDRPKGRMPDGALDEQLLADVRIPSAVFGYDRQEVAAVLGAAARGMLVEDDVRFTVVRGGYDMQFVDELLARRRTGALGTAPSPSNEWDGRMVPTTTEK